MRTVAFIRNLFLGAAGAVMVSFGASSADLEKVRVSIIPINDVAPLFSAIQQGYFREVGLEIDTTPSAGGAAGIPGLIGGSFDIVYGNVVSALLAAQQGLGIKATGGDPDRVTFKEIAFPQIEDALRQKRVDAAFLVAPFSVIALKKPGLTAIGKPYSEVQLGVDVGQYLTTGKMLT